MNTTILNNIIVPDVTSYLPTYDMALNDDVFVSYINKLFMTYNKKICSVQLKELNQYFIEINVTDVTYKLSENFRNKLKVCAEENIDILILPITLCYPNVYDLDSKQKFKTVKHSNVVIIDNINQKIEYFEPHGITYKGYVLQFDTEKLIRSFLSSIMDIIPIQFFSYEFKNVFDSCPYMSVQRNMDTFCLAWSLLFIELKILNRLVSANDIIMNITLLDDTILLDYIKKYVSYVKSTFKSAPNIRDAYPELQIQQYDTNINDFVDMSINDIVDKNVLIERIQKLIEEFKKTDLAILVKNLDIEENPQVKELKRKRKLIFNELASYSNFTDFYNLLSLA